MAFVTITIGQIALAADPASPPRELTAEQDHRLMMERLGIDSLRPGADGWNKDAPNAANSDESKASPYNTLPDPLVADDGSTITTPEQWRDVRRPEIVEHFEREIYGRVPDNAPAVTWHVKRKAEFSYEGGTALSRTLVGTLDNSGYPQLDVNIDATLVIPVNADGAVPVIIDFTFIWPGREPEAGASPITQPWHTAVLERGWGYATLIPTSYQADNGAGLTKGVIGLANHGQPRGPEDWGALRAWAWGASRLLDYLEADPTTDGSRVGITGLSRYGKAAAVTMAFDERFAIAFVGSSGQGGIKIMRRDFGERVENVASSGEYHWMAGNYMKYAGPQTPADLPIDAHHLVALCAPRPVFVSVGSLNVEGTWIDAVGSYLATAHATPVYELLGAGGLPTLDMPPEGTGLTKGELAFRQHEGGHTRGPNWPAFIEFGSRYLGEESHSEHRTSD